MKLASIQTIKSVRHHPNADRLDLVEVLGWQAVVKRNEFQIGDKVVFICIDTIVPKQPWSSFLAEKDNPEKPIRLKNIRLRGEYSSGLVLPMSVLSNFEGNFDEGIDVTDLLGVTKYEKLIPACLAGQAKGGFPTHLIPTTDEENGLSNPDIVEEVLKHPITITRKYDGSSCTIIIENGEITNVCSRKLDLKETEGNAFWRVARELVIPKGWSGIIQGECCGPGIQNNIHGFTKPTLIIFQIKKDNAWLDYVSMGLEIEKLHGEIVEHLNWLIDLPADLKQLQNFADALIVSPNNHKPSEGIVVRPRDYPSFKHGRPMGFKLINRNYKD